MDWTRMSECCLEGNHFGLVFVEATNWPWHVRFFPEQPAGSFVEVLEWLRTFIRQTTRKDLLELHEGSGTLWAVPGGGRDLNTEVVDDYVNSVEPPIRITRCQPGSQSTNVAGRGRKRLLMLANLILHDGRLSILA